MAVIFNGSNEYAGYFEAFKGGDAAVTIARGTKSETNVGEGFLVQQYTIQAQRGVNNLRFLNTPKVAAQVGALQGTCQLVGLLGTKKQFENLLTGGTAGDDICSPLVVTIKGSGSFQQCVDGKATASTNSITFVASGGIVQGVTVTGQVDQNGVLLQQGTVTFSFTKLELK